MPVVATSPVRVRKANRLRIKTVEIRQPHGCRNACPALVQSEQGLSPALLRVNRINFAHLESHAHNRTTHVFLPVVGVGRCYDCPIRQEVDARIKSVLKRLQQTHPALPRLAILDVLVRSHPGNEAAFVLGVRRGVAEEVLIRHCRAQLARLFGPQAASPKADGIKDWAQDKLTATSADQGLAGGHALPPPASIAQGAWRGRLCGVGSEWSPQFPGYVAGAIEAARLGVDALLAERITHG